MDHEETLRTFPLIGSTYPRGSRGSRREIVCGNYRVFEQRKLAEVLTIWHGARGITQITEVQKYAPAE